MDYEANEKMLAGSIAGAMVGGGSALSGAVKVDARAIESVVKRIYRLCDATFEVEDTLRTELNRLLGYQPETNAQAESEAPQPDGQISELNACLERLERGIRRASNQAVRVRSL